jgi:prepilin-type N-terminal cleavage/methylation domain-containing protein
MNRKAFTLIELMVSMAIMSMIGWYFIMGNAFDTRTNKINRSYKNLTGFISTAVLDGDVGYPSSKGGSCSDDQFYLKLTAERARDCSQLVSFDVGGDIGVNSEDGSKTWIIGLFRSLVVGGGKIYFDDVPGESDRIYIYCEFIDTIGDLEHAKKNRALLETTILPKLANDYSNLLVGVYPKATRVLDDKLQADGDTEADGTDIDGKFGLILRN